MRQLFLVFTLTLFCFTSCTTGSKYEQMIADYVQTSKTGVRTDLSFKAIEIKELPPITVADSIAILKKKFEEDNNRYLQLQEEYLENTKAGLEREKKARFAMQIAVDMHNKHIQNTMHRIDSVKALQFTSIYDNEAPSKILLKPVECRYSYILLKELPSEERTGIFYFLPDDSKITGEKQVKK